MPMFIRKDGEKAILLNKCGELLFGCSGEIMVTQGVYIPKSLSSGSSHFICKRAVWVPDSLSHEHLVQCLESFGATLPFSVQRVASLHRFGLCGINPTRTVHAIDKQFFLLAKVPHKQFAIYGIVQIRQSCPSDPIVIENISTSQDDVLCYVEWIQCELSLFHSSQQTWRRRTRHLVPTETDQGQLFESGSSKTMQGAPKHSSDFSFVETESELSVNTPEHPSTVLCEPECQCNATFSDPSNPNVISSEPYFPQQRTTKAACSLSSFFIT